GRRSGRARDLSPRFPSPCARRARAPRPRGERALRLPARLPRPLLREAPLSLRAPRARGPADVFRAGGRRWRTREGARAPLPCLRGGGGVSQKRSSKRVVTSPEHAPSGELIDDADAMALLRSHDLVSVGRAAD